MKKQNNNRIHYKKKSSLLHKNQGYYIIEPNDEIRELKDNLLFFKSKNRAKNTDSYQEISSKFKRILMCYNRNENIMKWGLSIEELRGLRMLLKTLKQFNK